MLIRNETLTFVLANLLDYFMTYIILYYNAMPGSPLRQRLGEGNPIAAYFINHWGPIKGMLGFKLSLVMFVIVLTQSIAYRNEVTGSRVLNLGTILTATVVLYSLMLLLRAL